ncbi:MAG: signal peptidase I [Vampirovibrionales bacterium]
MTSQPSPSPSTVVRLEDAIELALYETYTLSQRTGIPMSDALFAYVCLQKASLFSVQRKLFKQLGWLLTRPQRQQWWQTLLTTKTHSPNPLLTLLNDAHRSLYGILFLDPPGVRFALETFLNQSLLYATAKRLAEEQGHKLIDWVVFAEALSQTGAIHSAQLQLPSFPKDVDRVRQQLQQGNSKRRTLFVMYEVSVLIVQMSIMLMLIRQGIGEPRLIPSESMLPTLQIGDRLWIDKTAALLGRPYQRGDILVFYPPNTTLNNDIGSLYLRWTGLSGFLPKEMNIDVAFIKRMIADENQTINVVPNKGVYVDGQLLDEPYIKELAKTCTHVTTEEIQTCASITVPKGHVFMMGDNRNASWDSRYWGFLPKERIIGRAVYTLWPADHAGKL